MLNELSNAFWMSHKFSINGFHPVLLSFESVTNISKPIERIFINIKREIGAHFALIVFPVFCIRNEIKSQLTAMIIISLGLPCQVDRNHVDAIASSM